MGANWAAPRGRVVKFTTYVPADHHPDGQPQRRRVFDQGGF